MSSSTTSIGQRKAPQHAQQRRERAAAARRHPTHRVEARPATPPTAAFYAIAVTVAVFTMLGLVMVLSATSIDEVHQDRSPFGAFQKQALWAGLGLVGLLIAKRVRYHSWRRVARLGLAVGYLGMLLPFVPGLGRESDGARAWIGVGPLSVQPSEFLKMAVLLFCAHDLARNQDRMSDLRSSMRPSILAGGLACALCLAQKDLGTAIVIACIMLVCLFIAGAPLVPMMGLGLMSLVGAGVFVMSSPRRQARFTAFLDLAGHKDYRGYQGWQALIAIAEGDLTGSGINRGALNLGDYVPLAHSDFIFAVIAEELGLVGIVAVLGGFLVLAYAGMQVAAAALDRFGVILAGGVTGWLIIQAIINIGGVTGMMPVTGLTLPFFSAGGSSLFVTMCASGLLLNVARSVR